ncbi:MAG: GNAT family N-acetyltransferase [Rhizobiaceae bacterium]
MISGISGSDAGPLGRIGSLEVRLARGAREIAAALTLRHKVFYEELGATGDPAIAPARQDKDQIDSICDHLIVVDRSRAGDGQIVGTYRLLLHDRAHRAGGFYSDGEFELSALTERHAGMRFLELGRSCVLSQYRSKRTIEVLWQGIWAYCNQHSVDVMAGCASFPGTVPARHAQALSFLAHFRRADSGWDVRALASRYNAMDLMPAEAVDPKAAFMAMPPLIKGYVRLGAMTGDGCVIDRQFNTIDVMMILPRASISQRYIDHFGADASRFAA